MGIGDFLIYLNIIRKRLWLIILLLIVTVSGIVFISATADPVYRASVRLQVVASEPQEVALFSSFRAGASATELATAQTDFIRALQSGIVAWQTIAELNLGIGAYDLLNDLSITTEGPFISVQVQASDPEVAESLAVRHVENALIYYRTTRARPSTVIRQFIGEQLQEEQEKMSNAKKALLDFKLAHNLESLDREVMAIQDMIRNLLSQRDQTILAIAGADAKIVVYETEIEEALALADEAAEKEYTATADYYKGVARAISNSLINERATAEAKRIEVTELNRLIGERGAELTSLLNLTTEHDQLQRDLWQAENNYNFLWAKNNEAVLKEDQAMNVGFIQIVEPARRPDAPAASQMKLMLPVGAAASILGGIVLAFVLEFMQSVSAALREQRKKGRR